ncbi:hypothetical protein TREMEDRAFT_59880 [Tremella mesenterica DSM 1558]|uniref:uncharacterized protein n=1 Tax=Tremella mesenterica (strain ATCC 24925 / CBS 8224 / DSM 1558 / NBRC 9311 / NRRL Y-6157 / RJB 2259-6 / UBC 559-6) TaxID=578456 RepID=UPI0003F4A537|nr:uncharacterized protein TREMEDRAFT_59880 [Tremella mesenterica DSM 1558]EIW73707.1 hypothetical protein TREMEDRAFT_59880 [Tremella mesenterica DSM 1558]
MAASICSSCTAVSRNIVSPPRPREMMKRQIQEENEECSSSKSFKSVRSWFQPLRLRGGCGPSCCEDPTITERRRRQPLPQSPHWRNTSLPSTAISTRLPDDRSLRLALSRSIDMRTPRGQSPDLSPQDVPRTNSVKAVNEVGTTARPGTPI